MSIDISLIAQFLSSDNCLQLKSKRYGLSIRQKISTYTAKNKQKQTNKQKKNKQTNKKKKQTQKSKEQRFFVVAALYFKA